jgi:hypothetical protein
MPAWALKLAYQLRVHRAGAWGLDLWLIGLALLGAGGSLAAWPLHTGGDLAQRWPWGLAFLGLASALLALRVVGQKQQYVKFAPDDGAVAPPGACLDPKARILIHASGPFSVAGRRQGFTDLLAYWRTFASREHAVMAIVHPSRYLLVGEIPAGLTGMWYFFATPESIREIIAGVVTFGRVTGPALRVRCDEPPSPLPSPLRSSGTLRGRRQRRPAPCDLFLRFGDEAARDLVWADLLADAEKAHGAAQPQA